MVYICVSEIYRCRLIRQKIAAAYHKLNSFYLITYQYRTVKINLFYGSLYLYFFLLFSRTTLQYLFAYERAYHSEYMELNHTFFQYTKLLPFLLKSNKSFLSITFMVKYNKESIRLFVRNKKFLKQPLMLLIIFKY